MCFSVQLLVKVVVSIETALKYVYIESVVVAGEWKPVLFSRSCLGHFLPPPPPHTHTYTKAVHLLLKCDPVV